MKRLETISSKKLFTALTGLEVDRDDWIDGRGEDRRLKEQSADIVERLLRAGLDLRETSRQVTFVGVCSGQAETKSVFYRNSNVIPEIQARNVHGMLRDLSCYIDGSDKRKLRMLVVSAGWQPLLRYSESHRTLARKVSKFFARPDVKALGIKPLFSNIENTIKRDDGGGAMLNLHSHILIRADRYLGATRWLGFLDLARRYFGKGYVHDSALETAAEVVKYVFKPQEFEALEDWELALLCIQCHKLKFFRPLGDFRAWRARLRADGMKVKKIPDRKRAWRWVQVPKAAKAGTPNRTDPPPAGLVLGMQAPSARFATRLEPILIVEGYAGDLMELARQNRIEELVLYYQELWHAGGAEGLDSMEHNTTTTVPENRWPPGLEPGHKREHPPCHAN